MRWFVVAIVVDVLVVIGLKRLRGCRIIRFSLFCDHSLISINKKITLYLPTERPITTKQDINPSIPKSPAVRRPLAMNITRERDDLKRIRVLSFGKNL